MGRVGTCVVLLACAGCAQASLPGESDGAITFGSGMTGATDDPTPGMPPTETEADEDTVDPTDPSDSDDPSATGQPGVCGDGVVEGDEQCDLGPENAPDGLCTTDCQIASCGDGSIQELEECDDGDADNTDECIDNCRNATCGDGHVHVGAESCDDENDVDDDGCGNDCILSSCGDGAVQPPETCDDMNSDNGDACLDTCAAAACGDGVVYVGVEACDDGENGDNSDDCLAGCVAAACGDGVVHTGAEECDDGENGDNGDACVAGCLNAECGDGYLYNGNEECDDGDAESGDGCDSSCLSESITFSRDFTQGVAASAADCMAWDAFRSSLADTHASVTISGTNDAAGRTCTGPEAAQICTALRNGAAGGIACDGHTWYISNCLGIELTADDAACTCQNPGYAVRPCINHTDYGGVNTSTCAGPTQTMTVTCGF